jgi:excisionase family DNA binding protein
MEQESKMLTTEEVASRLRVTPKTLRSWVARGLIPVVRLPNGQLRFRADDLEDLLRSHRTTEEERTDS